MFLILVSKQSFSFLHLFHHPPWHIYKLDSIIFSVSPALEQGGIIWQEDIFGWCSLEYHASYPCHFKSLILIDYCEELMLLQTHCLDIYQDVFVNVSLSDFKWSPEIHEYNITHGTELSCLPFCATAIYRDDMEWNAAWDQQLQDNIDRNCGTPLCMRSCVCDVIISNELLDRPHLYDKVIQLRDFGSGQNAGHLRRGHH